MSKPRAITKPTAIIVGYLMLITTATFVTLLIGIATR